METKVCSECKIEKSVGEFYTHSGSGNLYSKCKVCHAKSTAQYSVKDKEPPEHEQRTVKWLLSRGIPAVSGKYISDPAFNFIDVVAFGCVRIECKIPQKDNRIYFTTKQRDTHPHADIVIIERNQCDFSVFPITYQGFFTGDKLQLAVTMEIEQYQAYYNRTDLIESALWQQRLSLIEHHKEKLPIQLGMFESDKIAS